MKRSTAPTTINHHQNNLHHTEAKKSGSHATMYLVNGDRYLGEWRDDKKHGRGIYLCKQKGTVYQGEWLNDHKHGFGTLSVRVSQSDSKSTDEKTPHDQWMDDLMKQWQPDSFNGVLNVGFRKVYAGQWVEGKRQGYGTSFDKDGSTFEGEWNNDQKNGWGVCYDAKGCRYEGEWCQGERHGQGMFLYSNGNRYEGMWFNDKKEGPGKFIYKSKRQCYQGEWANDIPKCGVLTDLTVLKRSDSDNDLFVEIPLPELKLAHPEKVLSERKHEIVTERIERLWKNNFSAPTTVVASPGEETFDSHLLRKKVHRFHNLDLHSPVAQIKNS